jgi:hypothetical protein
MWVKLEVEAVYHNSAGIFSVTHNLYASDTGAVPSVFFVCSVLQTVDTAL